MLNIFFCINIFNWKVSPQSRIPECFSPNCHNNWHFVSMTLQGYSGTVSGSSIEAPLRVQPEVVPREGHHHHHCLLEPNSQICELTYISNFFYLNLHLCNGKGLALVRLKNIAACVSKLQDYHFDRNNSGGLICPSNELGSWTILCSHLFMKIRYKGLKLSCKEIQKLWLYKKTLTVLWQEWFNSTFQLLDGHYVPEQW